MKRNVLRVAVVAAVCAPIGLLACETPAPIVTGSGGMTGSTTTGATTSTTASTTAGPTTGSTGGGLCVLDTSKIDQCMLQ